MTLNRIAAFGLAVVLAVAGSLGVALAETKAAPASKVNVNTATVQQLEELPGVGPALAARIVEYRQKSGGFKSTQELLNVKGIGEKSLQKLQPHVTVGEGTARASSSR
jgi:competence protein ComEA